MSGMLAHADGSTSRPRGLLIAVVLALAVSGCTARAAPQAAAPTPTSASEGQPVSQPGVVTASVEVVPAQQSDLAFVISAGVKQINVKEGDQVKAGQPLIVLDTPDLDASLASAQAELKSALANQAIQRQGRRTRIQRGHRTIWLGSMPEIRQKADARVGQAHAGLAEAQANQVQGTLLAPFDGTVVSLNVNPGEMVQAHETVLVLGDLSDLQLQTTDLSEREIDGVRLGQTATTRLKAFDLDIPGKVTAIKPLAGEKDGDTVFRVTITPERPPAGLLWGMTGDVQIQTR
jgi:RND family efflux transporter MFP subunit